MTTPELFQTEVDRSLRRYLQQPGVALNVTFRDDHRQPMPYAQALPGVFSQWLEIQSPWERRNLIYREALDQMFSNNLMLW
ncbi:hypothetical protein IFO70_25250 [Phormidium tenue FACHB-886]|nr:hypothetical protein [Phormidium tenue FACHB-886]